METYISDNVQPSEGSDVLFSQDAAVQIASGLVPPTMDTSLSAAADTLDAVQKEDSAVVLIDGADLKSHVLHDDYQAFAAWQAEFNDFFKQQSPRNRARLLGTRHYIERQRKLKGLLEPEKLSASDIRELNGTFREKQEHTPLTDKELAEMAEGVLAVNILAGRIDDLKDEQSRQAAIQQITANLEKLNKAGLDIMLRHAQSQYKTEKGRLKVARQLVAEEAKMSRTIIAGGIADDVKDDPQPSQRKEENTVGQDITQNEKADPQPSHKAENTEDQTNATTENKSDKKADERAEKEVKEETTTEQKIVVEQPVYNSATDQVVGKTVKYAAVMKAYDALDKIAKDIKDHPFDDNMPINHLSDAAERAGFELSGIWVRIDGKKNVFRTDIKGMENLTRIDGKRGMTSQELLHALQTRMNTLDHIIKGEVTQTVSVGQPETVSKSESTEPQTKRGMRM